MTIAIEWSAAIIALLFCVHVGVAFGSYPAAKASKVMPIEALLCNQTTWKTAKNHRGTRRRRSFFAFDASARDENRYATLCFDRDTAGSYNECIRNQKT